MPKGYKGKATKFGWCLIKELMEQTTTDNEQIFKFFNFSYFEFNVLKSTQW